MTGHHSSMLGQVLDNLIISKDMKSTIVANTFFNSRSKSCTVGHL
jgi:hypothetical protein